MAMLGRRFINIVAAGKYRPGLLSVHRLDVSKHLFYPSASEALRFVGGDVGDPHQQPMTEMQEELPAPCAIFSDATTTAACRRSTAFFSLVSPRNSEGEAGRILFTNEAGDSIMYYAADEGGPTGHTHAMPGPGLEDFSGPVAASVSIVAQQADGGGAAAKEQSMYVVHGVRDRVARFHVLRFGTPPPPTPDRWGGSTRVGEGWYWQSLPPPPFVSDDRPHAVINSYTVVEGGRTICVSSWSYAAWGGTWCFDTVRGEWWHAGDWEMPFDGRAEYLADLDLWLGFSSHPDRLDSTSTITHGDLCTTSGLSLSAMAMNQPPTLLHRLWRDHNRKPKQMELINLGSGRFAIAKVFNLDDGYTSDYDCMAEDDDEFLVLNGVEIRPRQPRDSCDNIRSCSDGLELIHHKSISYMLDTHSHRIHQVL